jgi:two-component system sensor histidine kinase UhpB
LKHSQATKAEISFSQDQQNLYLSVKDNGKGIDAELVGNGKGIKNIKNRVETLIAMVDFNSVINEGTIVRIMVPLIKKT